MADEVIEVDAVVVEEDIDQLVDSLSIDETLDKKLDRLKAAVKAKIEPYETVKPIETDEQYKEAKGYRTTVRGLKDAIDGKRKAKEKRYKDLLKTFDGTIREITAPIDELDTRYKAEIDRYEESCRSRRLEALKAYYGELAEALAPVVPYERIADNKWLNRSFGEMKAKKAIEERVARLANQYRFVDGLDYADDAEKAWAVNWWADALPDDSSEVAEAVMRHREEIGRAARFAKGYERAMRPQAEPEPLPTAPEPETQPEPIAPRQAGYRVVIECATADELRKVKAVMVENGIHGRVERM